MKLEDCQTPFEISAWLISDSENWDGKRNKYVHYCTLAVEYAFMLGQQSRALPVVTVGDKLALQQELYDLLWKGMSDRRSKPRGDVARGLVDAALDGGEPQNIPPRLYAGFPACYLAPVPEIKEID